MAYEAGLSNELAPGSEVYSRDGVLLGTVKDIGGTTFRITGAPKDFWMGHDFIGTVEGTRVTLVIPADRVEEYKTKK